MKKKTSLLASLYLCLAALLHLSSCEKIEDHEPDLIPISGELPHPVSDIHLPLLLSIAEIEELINSKLDGEIYNDSSFDKDNLKLSISKIGRITVDLRGDQLYYKLPLHIWLEVRVEKKIIGKVKVKKQQVLDFSLVLHFKSKLQVDEQWKPVVSTELLRYEWVKKPKVKIAFFKVGVAKLVENQLDNRMDDLLSKIDQTVHEKLEVKPLVAKVWRDIQKPILINKKVERVWLKAEPEKLYMSHINGKGGYLQLNIRLQAKIRTVIGDTAGIPIQKELPPLLGHKDASNYFELYAKSTLPLELLTDLLNEKVGEKELSIEGYEDYKLVLKKFQVMSSDSQVVVKVRVKGEVNGDIYFQGRPTYDTLAQELTVENFDFNVNSEEVLLNTANWLLRDEVKARVQEELRLPLGDKLSQLPMLIQAAIDQSKVSDKASIQLSNIRLEPRDILVTKNNVQVLMRASGNVDMELERLE